MSFARYEQYKPSGVNWLGEVPASWKVARIRHLFEIVKRIAGTDGYTVLAVTQQGIKEKDIESGDGQLSMDYSKYQLVEIGDFAMNHMDLLTGYVDISPISGVTSPDYRVFRVRDTQAYVDRYYLYLFQMAYKNKIFFAFGQGSSQLGRWRLPSEQFKDFYVPLPPPPDQHAIVSFLDAETSKIDALVAEQEKLIALLKEKRQVVISNAVTKGLNPTVSFKDSASEWLGAVPAHWQVKPLRYVASIVRGASPRPAGDPRYFGGSFMPWVTVAEITKDELIDLTETETCLTEEGAQHSNLFKAGTVIYSNSGATLGVPKILGMDACANDGVIAFERLSPDVHPHFLYHFLASITGTIREKIKQGSGQPNLNTDIVKSIRFSLPPMAEQEQIVTYIDEINGCFVSLATEAQRAIDLLQERRTALITWAVTGKIDVRGCTNSEPSKEAA